MPERWVDVSHEALIRGWPRLRQWIEEDRAGLRLHRRLTEAAQEWHHTRDEGALYRGVRLAQTEEWRQRNGASLNELERTFLDASLALERSETAAREHRRRRVVYVLSAALVVFGVLAAFAVWQWRQASRQTEIALARQLGAQADLSTEPQLDARLRRLLLATEAVARLQGLGVESEELDLVLRRQLAALPLPHRLRTSIAPGSSDVQLALDGRTLIVGNFANQDAVVMNVATGSEMVRLAHDPSGLTITHPGAGEPIVVQIEGTAGRKYIGAISSDGRYAVTEADDGVRPITQVWDLSNGQQRVRIHEPGSHSYQFSEDGRYLAVSTSIFDPATRTYSATTTRVWDVEGRRELGGTASGVVRVFSAAPWILATSAGLWGLGESLTPLASWGIDTFDVVLSGDGGYAALIAERDGRRQVEVWSKDGRMTRTMPLPGADVFIRAVSADGRVVILTGVQAAPDAAEEVQMFDVESNALLMRAAQDVRAAAVTPDGRNLIATRDADELVDVWELVADEGAWLSVNHGGEVIAALIDPRGHLATIARTNDGLALRAWDLATRRELVERRAEVPAQKVVASPDGVSFAAIAASDVALRRADDATAVITLRVANAEPVLWSPDGRHVATQSGREVQVWTSADGRPVAQFTLPEYSTIFALLPGGEAVAERTVVPPSGRRNQPMITESVWSVATRQPDAGRAVPDADALAGNPDARRSARLPTEETHLAFDAGGRYVATLRDQTRVHVWALRRADLIDQACRRLSRNLSEDEWRDYIGGTRRKTCAALP